MSNEFNGTSHIYAQCLYTRGIVKAASELFACKFNLDEIREDPQFKDHSNPAIEDYAKELQKRRDTLKTQLYENFFVSLDDMAKRLPESYTMIMALKDSVTCEVIHEVWTHPHNEIIQNFSLLREQLCQHNYDKARVERRGGVFDTIRCLSSCKAFMQASVAEKAALLVMKWGKLAFDPFRLMMQVFFGLTDVQLLAILMGNTDNAGLLRLYLEKGAEEAEDGNRVVEKGDFVLMVEPVYGSGHGEYGDRNAFDTLLEAFYPYIPQSASWDEQHWLYHVYIQLIQSQNIEENTLLKLDPIWLLPPELYEIPYAEYFPKRPLPINPYHTLDISETVCDADSDCEYFRILSSSNIPDILCVSQYNFHIQLNEKDMTVSSLGCMLTSFPVPLQRWFLSLLNRSMRYFELVQGCPNHKRVQSFVSQQLLQCGNGILLDELFKLGKLEEYTADEIMQYIMNDLENIMICGDGSKIRQKLPIEYKEGQYFAEHQHREHNEPRLGQCPPMVSVSAHWPCLSLFHKPQDKHDAPFSSSQANSFINIMKQTASQTEVEEAIKRFQTQQNDETNYTNNCEKVLAFLQTLDKCINLSDLKDACCELFSMPASSVSRVLKCYSDKFWNPKRGIWCSQSTALRLGLNTEQNKI